jgi:serine/threonine protein phosphatase 1
LAINLIFMALSALKQTAAMRTERTAARHDFPGRMRTSIVQQVHFCKSAHAALTCVKDSIHWGKTVIRSGRLLAVGDIHGCRRALRRLLKRMALTRRDRIIFLGDYIDRGPDPRGVIDDLIALHARVPRSVFLKGNHEQMLLDVLAGRNLRLYLANGGAVTLTAYLAGGRLLLPAAHRRFLAGLRLRYETPTHIFVHAGLRPGLAAAAQSEQDLLWIREAFLYGVFDWGKTVVFGHTPLRRPFFGPRRIGLDTGAVYGGTLTGCDLRTRRCWQARE